MSSGGFLVEGFTHPALGMQYNLPYYQQLFEDYGFKFYFEQVSNHLDMTKPLPPRFTKIAKWVSQKPGYDFRHLKINNLEKYVGDFIEIYNDAWQFHENFTPMDPKNLLNQFNKMKQIIDERLIWFAYVNDEPVAFLIMIPDINQIFKKLNGKMNFWSILKYFYYKNFTKTIDRARIIVMGVKPKYQKSGIESGIFINIQEIIYESKMFREG